MWPTGSPTKENLLPGPLWEAVVSSVYSLRTTGSTNLGKNLATKESLITEWHFPGEPKPLKR